VIFHSYVKVYQRVIQNVDFQVQIFQIFQVLDFLICRIQMGIAV
jgi:hypothetical protein